MNTYHKIYGPYRRATEGPDRNKVIPGLWTSAALEYLAELRWTFTEKVDGTNVRVHWDGHRVTFGGRTDRAQMPPKLITRLEELFPEELFEQAFGATDVLLFGEGYGPGIQKAGGNYGLAQDFVLFDVQVGERFLPRGEVDIAANQLGIESVPIRLRGNLYDAIEMVSSGMKSYFSFGDFWAEGLVGVPDVSLLNDRGERIVAKIKHVDFFEGDK